MEAICVVVVGAILIYFGVMYRAVVEEGEDKPQQPLSRE